MLAVPLHGDDVAPRFCSADEFMIAELDGGRVHRICRLTIRDEAWSRRLERLSAAGVKVLLCGGFNRSFLPQRRSPGHSGDLWARRGGGAADRCLRPG